VITTQSGVRSTTQSEAAHINTGPEPVDGLSLTHLGNGYCPPLAVRRLDPGRSLSLAVFGADPEDTGVVIVRWRRPDRSEYLWRMSLVGPGLQP